jgi:Flp pilus assembly protein TadD
MNQNALSRSDATRTVEAAFLRHKRGELEPAAAVYRRVLDAYPDHAAALHYLGLIAQQTGNSLDAARLLRRSIEIDPNDPRAHNHLGQIYVALDDKRVAAECFERALTIDPNHVDSLNNLANVLQTRDLDQAIALYRRAVELRPDAAFAHYNLAKALNEDNAFDEAQALYERVIEIDPRHQQARFNLGVLLEQKGRFQEAIGQYLEVQRLRPKHVSSLANLVAARDYQPDTELIARAEEIAAGHVSSDEDRIKLHRGLGKHYDRVEEYERAFRHFERAKALMRARTAPFDISKVSDAMSRLVNTFDRQLFAPESPRGSLSRRPIFIVGLPRSGTTLTEQILASHPAVFGAGEVQEMPIIVKSLRPEYPDSVATMDEATLTDLAERYLAALDSLGGVGAERVTDKLPLNTLHLGLIAKLFPQATIVHVRRDPLDVAISSFIELFEFEHDYTTRFDDFGGFYLEHQRLMDHWRAVLPIPLFELRYEDLIDNTESVARTLITHCGLKWDPTCMRFQDAERTIRTPSRWQVRQPIYASSVGRWRNYAGHMQALVDLMKSSSKPHAEHLSAHSNVIAGRTAGAAELSSSSSAAASQVPGAKCTTALPLLPCPLRRPVFIVSAPRSGSTLLFETIAASNQICTVGDEAHWLVEDYAVLQPGAGGVDSNRLTDQHGTDAMREGMVDKILLRLINNLGEPEPADGKRVFVEKTPKNSLRIPFFTQLFPTARFLFLWRDPRENVSSIMQAWRAGQWQTYRQLDGWNGPWSLLLPPGWQQLSGRSLEEVAAYQWECTNRIILDDLAKLPRDRWCALSYGDLVANPTSAMQRVMRFAELEMDAGLAQRLAAPLPQSRYTHTVPAPEKWRINQGAIERVLPGLEPMWRRLRSTT